MVRVLHVSEAWQVQSKTFCVWCSPGIRDGRIRPPSPARSPIQRRLIQTRRDHQTTMTRQGRRMRTSRRWFRWMARRLPWLSNAPAARYPRFWWLCLLLLTFDGCRSQDKPEPRANPATKDAELTAHPVIVPATIPSDRDAPSPRPSTNRFFFPTGASRPPFVLVLHALGGSGEQIERELGLASFAQRRGFAYAAPDGSMDAQGRRVWNAGRVCCNFSHRDIDDVARLIGIIRDAVSGLSVDARRVFVVGYSNGGFMAHRLACEHASGIRGIVSIAAAGPGSEEHCAPTDPVAILEVHGDRDTVVSYRGGHLFGRAELPSTPSVETSLSPWVRANHCEGTLRFNRRFDLIAALPGEETIAGEFNRCTVPIRVWKILGGQHWLGLDTRALDFIWQFLLDPAQAK